ncbi:MAG: MFS transporter [Halanaeroarchaeum sp.]
MSVERSWGGVVAVAVWQITASSTYYGVFAATAAVSTAFGVSRTQIGILLATLTLGYTLMLFPAGAVVDAYGDRPSMVAGLSLLGVGSVIISFAPTYAVLLLAVFLLGSAYATAMPSTNRAIASRAPRGRYNLAIGIKQVGVTGGSAIASIAVTNASRVGGTWRSAFFAVGVVAAVVAVVFALRYGGTTDRSEVSFPDLRRLRSNSTYVMLAASGFFIGAAVFTTTGYFVPYLNEAGTSVEIAGIALATMQVSGSMGRVAVGELADRIPGAGGLGAMRVMMIQLTTAAALFLALPLSWVSVDVAFVAVLGVSILGVTGLYHGTLVRLVDRDETGAATAGGQTTINLGGLLTPPAFGLLADAFGYSIGWWLIGAGTALSVVVVFLARRRVETA